MYPPLISALFQNALTIPTIPVQQRDFTLRPRTSVPIFAVTAYLSFQICDKLRSVALIMIFKKVPQ
jgi:hypothetical protein